MEDYDKRSPADRYMAHKARTTFPRLTEFRSTLSFELDPFQVAAAEAMEEGSSVLVCAPTGAGKTVVGEFAADLALASGKRCFYTTPIKALSNQKYHDFIERYGAHRVGLLTGDIAINPGASVVVMTTEVLRNMLYADSAELTELGSVVLDEVHYLADRFRGPVWEEVILTLPGDVLIASLSATVSNAEEFGDWLREVRGNMRVIVEETRPVPLWQHMMVGTRRFDLFQDHIAPVDRRHDTSGAKINPDLLRALDRRSRHTPYRAADHQRRRRRGAPSAQPRYGAHDRVSRSGVIGSLDRGGLLPAIVFIFSRAGCDAALAQCVRDNVWLTDEAERASIRQIIGEVTADLPHHDLVALDFFHWSEALERGLAAHHAGMLPAFKVAVEKLFTAGLVKAVFATETLALGINMPARSVVIEQLSKFNGEAIVDITPGEYTQLTGRAGRRGIDVEGHAVVMARAGVDPVAVASLASTRTYRLVSSFRPRYNMTMNLVSRLGLSRSHDLIQRSFAQFQTNQKIVSLANRVTKNNQRLHKMEQQLTCSRGDINEFLELEQRLTRIRQQHDSRRSSRRKSRTGADLLALQRGDVIYIPRGKRQGFAVVLDTRRDHHSPIRPLIANEHRWAGRIEASDFHGPIEVLATVKLEKFTEHWLPKVRRDLASSLAALRLDPPTGRIRPGDDGDLGDAGTDMTTLQRAIRRHPVAGCPDLARHRSTIGKASKLARTNKDLTTRVDKSRGSLSRQFKRVVTVLTELEYLRDGVATKYGRQLERIWSVNDLLVMECLRHGVWDDLPPDQLAGAVCAVLFESRSQRSSTASTASGSLGSALQTTHDLWGSLHERETRLSLPLSPEPDSGLTAAIVAWANGASLAHTLAAANRNDDGISAGDFVRWCRQVIDLLEQLNTVGDATIGQRASIALGLLRRGVVSAAMM